MKKTNTSIIFFTRFKRKPQTIGMGKSKIYKSMNTLEMLLPWLVFARGRQWPGVYGSQNFFIGRHPIKVRRKKAMIHRVLIVMPIHTAILNQRELT